MKQTGTQKNAGLTTLFIQYFGVLATLVLILLSFWEFTRQTAGYSRDRSKEQLNEIALQTANTVQIKVNDAVSYLAGAAGYFAEIHNLRSKEALSLLSGLAEKGGFYGLRIVLPDGMGYAALDNVVDLSQREYFKKGIAGETGMSHAFIAYVPIFQDGMVAGVLCGLYKVESLYATTEIANFRGQLTSLIFQQNGNILLRSGDSTGFGQFGNVWDTYSRMQFTGQTSYQKFSEYVTKGMGGFIEYDLDGETRIACYMPIGVNDWYTLHVISASTVAMNIEPVNQMGASLIVKIFICFMLLVAGIVYYTAKSRNALIHINRRLDFLTNALPGGVQKCSPDEKGEFLYLSDGFMRMFGYSREEIEQKFQNSFYQTVYAADLPKVKQKLEDSKIGDVIELEYRIMTKRGGLIWVLDKCTLTRDEQGKPLFYCVCMDVTNLKRIQQELQLSNERFRISMAHTSNVIFEYDLAQNRISFVTKTRSIYGLPSEVDEISDLANALDPESAAALKETLEKIREGARDSGCLIQIRRANGKTAWNRVTVTNIFNDFGKPVRAIGMLEDVTEKKEAELRYAKEKQYRSAMLADVRLIFEINVTQDSFSIEFGGRVEPRQVHLPERFSEALPIIVAKSVNPKERELVLQNFNPQNLLRCYQNGETSLVFEYRTIDQCGNKLWVSNRVNLLKEPETGDVKAFSYVRDIDEQKRKELALKYQSERDPLTELYNRATLEKKITAFLNTEELSLGGHGFLMIDLDNFKNINDSYGHLFGDTLLRQVSATIREVFRATDFMARLGGDEFAVFMKGARSKEHIVAKAKELVESLRKIHLEENPESCVSSSIGIAFAPEHGSTFEQLYQKADEALYHVKRTGKNCCCFYDDSMSAVRADEAGEAEK